MRWEPEPGDVEVRRSREDDSDPAGAASNVASTPADDAAELAALAGLLRGHLARAQALGTLRVAAPRARPPDEMEVAPATPPAARRASPLAASAVRPAPARDDTPAGRSSAPAPSSRPPSAPSGGTVAAPPPGHPLALVREELGECTRCKLHAGRTNLVFGVGDPNADLVFVGEGPGAHEDQQGIPFVGDAGQLLTRMIEAMGWRRDEVYICNVVKCRPPGNRNPEPDEIAACEPFLRQQLAAIRPRVIVALGKFAAQQLTGKPDAAISALRGRFHEYQGIRVMPTYHPAYLLRTPSQKRLVWEDLQLVIKELERLGIRPPPRD